MNRAASRPSSQLLAIEVQRYSAEQHTAEAQGNDSHERTNVTNLHNPIVQEFAHTVTPHILEHGGTDKVFTGGRLVTVDLREMSVR